MSTSIIDYIFRELAVTYLSRYELAHVDIEDTRPDSVQSSHVSSPIVSQNEPAQSGPSGDLSIAERPAAPSWVVVKSDDGAAQQKESKASLSTMARMKGYEGDACPECGQFTMVRNGTCLKCMSCGSTTGCS
jgi:ribonucleoside-diphosphate reductase alpha chain